MDFQIFQGCLNKEKKARRNGRDGPEKGILGEDKSHSLGISDLEAKGNSVT